MPEERQLEKSSFSRKLAGVTRIKASLSFQRGLRTPIFLIFLNYKRKSAWEHWGKTPMRVFSSFRVPDLAIGGSSAAPRKRRSSPFCVDLAFLVFLGESGSQSLPPRSRSCREDSRRIALRMNPLGQMPVKAFSQVRRGHCDVNRSAGETRSHSRVPALTRLSTLSRGSTRLVPSIIMLIPR